VGALSPADDHGRVQPVLAAVPGVEAAPVHSSPAGVRVRVPGVWLAANDSDRQWGAVLDPRRRRALALGRLVDSPRQPAGTHCPGASGSERTPRTNAQHLEGRDRAPSALERSGATASVRAVSPRIQSPASPSRTGPPDAP